MENVALIIVFSILLCVMAVICTALVRRERQEKEAALLDVANAKTEFLSRVSYDIKTPMNVIIGTASLGMEETDNPEKMQEYLGEINAAGRFLMGLLEDLIDMSKIETGRFRLHPKSYAFGNFLKEIQIMMEPSCKKKHIIFCMPEEEINVNMMVDPMRFQQLFFNLLTNAVKFTPEGGEVTFRVCNYATHNQRFAADYIVKDNGIGMSKEFQRFLFEPFTKESKEQAEQKNGAGLGLAIARNIVDLMGGTIEIKSELGVGTEVKVHLEIETASVQPENVNEPIEAKRFRQILEGKRVLLVEDNPLNVEISRHIMEKQGMNVVCAENGDAALELFRCEKAYFFDLIVMDICMPKMDGFEAAKRIRKTDHADAQTIPIIATSAKDLPEDVDECKESGMNDYIAKPMEPQALYQVLCEYLQNPV